MLGVCVKGLNKFLCVCYTDPVSYTHLDVYKRQVLERDSNFECHSYNVSYTEDSDVVNKFNYIYWTIRRTLKYTSKETHLSSTTWMAFHTLLYWSENQTTQILFKRLGRQDKIGCLYNSLKTTFFGKEITGDVVKEYTIKHNVVTSKSNNQ